MTPIVDRISAAGRSARSSALALAILAAPMASHAQTTLFGALTNFDVYNDTGQDAHGFEIELDGVTQVPYYFSSTRYGGPTIVPFQGGVYVRYTSAWNASTQQFMATTQVPASFTPTGGHSCVLTLINGCDHYGVAIYINPAAVAYRWLVADPANPGQLIRFGTNVSIPTPVVTINPAPQPGAAPDVVFRIEVPRPPRISAKQSG
ncbi:MAG: hypothetical protein ACR2NN_17690 [Bryobacteraceae bacterium]